MKIILRISLSFILIMLPLSLAWWLYFPSMFISIFLFRLIYTSLFAGFVLDIIYFGSSHEYPIMTGASLAVAVLFVLLKDKLRLDYVFG